MKIAEKITNIQLPRVSRRLPDNWRKVAGILRGRKNLLVKHVNAVRSEWK